MNIVAMQNRDIPSILELEANTVSAWSREHFEDELQQPAGFQFVAQGESTARKLGVLCGRIMADEAEILKLSVAESARQKGIGYCLLDFALQYCRLKGAKTCYLEMRATNKAARSLYEKRGFSQVGIRKNYYTGPVEDAVMLKLGLE